VNCVQFHKQALEQTEWIVYEPSIKRDSPKHKVTKVELHVQRCPNYYLQNIIGVMFTLSLLGLLCFAMDIDDLGSRVGNLLTLILAAVAFKFVVAQILPRVPYNTLIDYYMIWSGLSLAVTAFFSIIPSFFEDSDTQKIVNKAMFVLSAIFIVGSLLTWLVMALLSMRRRNRKLRPVTIVKDKNWYAARFSTPFFLPALNPVSTSVKTKL
jgi:preprotein translocase subunit SecG